MAKRKSGTPAKRKEVKALQVWELRETQKAVLLNARDRHVEEHNAFAVPLKRYQENQIMQFLREIKKELGIPDGTNVRFTSEDKLMVFTEVPPEPRVSPTTQDLTKKPQNPN